MTKAHELVYPTPITGGDSEVVSSSEVITAQIGLTKLEWFTGMALAGINEEPYSYEELAKKAVKTAYAIIEELNK